MYIYMCVCACVCEAIVWRFTLATLCCNFVATCCLMKTKCLCFCAHIFATFLCFCLCFWCSLVLCLPTRRFIFCSLKIFNLIRPCQLCKSYFSSLNSLLHSSLLALVVLLLYNIAAWQLWQANFVSSSFCFTLYASSS